MRQMPFHMQKNRIRIKKFDTLRPILVMLLFCGVAQFVEDGRIVAPLLLDLYP